MATIKEVASRCGVSIATVSNVLNGKGRASEEMRRKILDTAQKMEYVPNMMAKNLKQRHTKMIGIITEDLTVFNTAYIVDGINEYLDEHGYTFLLGNLRLYQKYDNWFYHNEEYHAQVEEAFRLMQGKQVNGVIYIGAHCREIRSIPQEYGVPIVMAYGYSVNSKIPSVVYDDEHAAYVATEVLIRAGHREIGVLAGELSSGHTMKRQRGYQQALYDHEILYNPNLIYYCDWERQKGYEACKILHESGVRAFFSMSDVMAAGVYDYTFERGLVVGKDIALVGFDNREISRAFKPGLATMEVPLSEIGKKAAEVLVSELEGEKEENQEIYELQCRFIERKSV